MASRALSDLHPDLRPLAEAFLSRCLERQVDVLIVCTYRSDAEQTKLYAQGRTMPGPRVTNAKAGQSAHNATLDGKPAARAFDAVPLLHGKAIWEDPRDKDGDWTNDFGWRVMGEVAEEVGLDWYGKPTARFREAPHFQMRRSA
jgi:peptidoglycan LD-endopeptidase CwlK